MNIVAWISLFVFVGVFALGATEDVQTPALRGTTASLVAARSWEEKALSRLRRAGLPRHSAGQRRLWPVPPLRSRAPHRSRDAASPRFATRWSKSPALPILTR